MSDTTTTNTTRETPREKTETTVGGMPGDLLQGSPPGVPRGEDRITSSGVAPTGGIPVGGATDRIIPDRSIPKTANNVPPDEDIGLGKDAK